MLVILVELNSSFVKLVSDDRLDMSVIIVALKSSSFKLVSDDLK